MIVRRARALALSTLLWLASPAGHAQVDERAMKAAFLYNFAVFTEWPTPPGDRLDLCVLGHTQLDEALASLQGRPVRDGAPLTVRHIDVGESLAGCRLLYIGERSRDIDTLLTRLKDRPVLTVTDADGLSDRGVMIEMRKRGQRIAFDVNLPAARRARLDFSARLLRLAAFVARES